MKTGAKSVSELQTLWRSLGLSGSREQAEATLRGLGSDPKTVALLTGDFLESEPLAAAQMGVSLHPLPRLSVAPLASNGAERAVSAGSQDIQISGVLGEGGMGRVLLAKQRSLSREVAIKTLHSGADGRLAEALIAEGIITGSLEHPNIVPIHALGLDADGKPILVMKRLTGIAWDELIDNPAHPAWDKLTTLPRERLRAHIEILMSVCQALSLSHSRGVIHRDVKPENVMLGEFGEVYLLDFGVAVRLRPEDEHAEPRRIVGTPGFMAPEMVDNALAIGPFTDVYLLGATLHRVLTRRNRHNGHTLESILLAAYQSIPVDYGREVPKELAELCNAATARDPDQRPDSALSFRSMLSDYLAHEGSLVLARAALERLEELERTLVDDPQRALRAATECRFGYLTALRDWANNPEAKAGLRRCLLCSIELEIRLENVVAARALLSELESAPAELVAALESVEREVLRRAENTQRLRRIDWESDLGVALSARRRLMLALAGLATLIWITVSVLRTEFGLSVDLPGSLVISGAMLLVTLSIVLIFRTSLGENAVNRRLVFLMLINLSLSFAHRLELLSNHGTVVQAFQGDLLLTTLSCAANALFVHRLWWRGVYFMLAAVVLSFVAPALAETAFGVAIIAMLINWAFGWKPEAPFQVDKARTPSTT